MQKRKATSRTKSSKKRRNDDAITEDANKESYEVQKKQDKEQEGKERHKGQEEEFSKYEMHNRKEAEKLEEEEVNIKKESEEEEIEEELTEEESHEEQQNEAEVEVEEEPTDEESYEEQQDEIEVYSREDEEVEVEEEYEDEPTEEESSEELKNEVETYGGENKEIELEEESELELEEDEVEDVEREEPEEEDPEAEQEAVRQEELKSVEVEVEVEKVEIDEEEEVEEEEEEEEEDKMEEVSVEEEEKEEEEEVVEEEEEEEVEEEEEEEEDDVLEDDEEEIAEDEELDEVREEGEEDEVGKGEEPLREPTQEEPLEVSEHKNMRHACLDKDFPGELETLRSMKMDFQKNDDAACGKKRTSRWDEKPRADGTNKTRWSNDEAQIKMRDPLHVPDLGNNLNLSRTDPEISELTARLSDINQKLLVGELIYDQPIQKDLVPQKTGRKVSLHQQLIMEKEKIISELMKKTFVFKSSLPEIKPAKFCKKLYIPVKEYPGYNFVGLIMGPCGNSKIRMEKETGARIFVRGRGSAKEGTGKQEKDSHEDLHVLIEADSQQSLGSAVRMVEKILVPVEDVRNVHKRAQLRELAELKATMKRKNPTGVSNECSVCGNASHLTVACPLTAPNPDTHLDACQMISSVLGVGPSPFSPSCESSTPIMQRSVVTLPQSSTEKFVDECNLFVGYLPKSMNEDKLIDLFAPFGRICQARVVRDKITGLSKGYGFIKFTNKENAANAIAKINGYPIDRKKLAVRVAGSPTSASRSDTSLANTLSSLDLPTYPGAAAILQCTVASSDWSCPPVSMLPDANGYFIDPFHHAGQPANMTSITSSSKTLLFDRQPSVSSSSSCQLLPSVGQSPLPSVPSNECPVNSSGFANEKRLSIEFNQFPGYLNSLDLQFQKSTPTNIFESLIHHPEDKNHI